jgi:serine/threonine protein kinase
VARGPLGEGGFGRILRALDTRLDREVAVKVLRPDRLGRPEHTAHLVTEARITAGLDHPAIVPVHELDRLADGQVYYTMKIVEGVTLSRARTLRIEQEGLAAGLRSVLQLALRAVAAVAHAHEEGVVHRDLKPTNILVGDRDETWVVDWGLAVSVGTPTPGRSGTPGYLPPEPTPTATPSADV